MRSLEEGRTGRELPSVTVIIPCLNEEAYIGPCLDSLIANDIPKDRLEVIVVDGLSTDRTREIVQSFTKRYPFIWLMDNPRKLKPVALNLGIKASNSDVVVRIDAHSSYATDYLSKLISGLFAYNAQNIGGVRETRDDGGLISIAAAEAVSHRFAAGDAHYRTAGETLREPLEVDTVFCGCYRREVFDEIGLFNEELIRTQDREFNQRLRAAGGKIVLDPSIRCWYYPRTSLRRYARWSFDGGFWVFYARRFTDTRMLSPRNYVPAAFVAWNILAAGLILAAAPFAPAALVPIAAYWGLNLYYSARVALKQRRGSLLGIMPWYFAGTHYPYGIGSLAGWALSALPRRSKS